MTKDEYLLEKDKINKVGALALPREGRELHFKRLERDELKDQCLEKFLSKASPSVLDAKTRVGQQITIDFLYMLIKEGHL